MASVWSPKMAGDITGTREGKRLATARLSDPTGVANPIGVSV